MFGVMAWPITSLMFRSTLDIPERNDPKSCDELTFTNGNLRWLRARSRIGHDIPLHTIRNLEYRPKLSWWQLTRPSLQLEIASTPTSFGYGLNHH
jgi:hypothetical protein